MTEPSSETEKIHVDYLTYPLLIRNDQGKLLNPLVPDWTNIAKRISGDGKTFADEAEKRANTRGSLHIEVLEAENVNRILQKAGGVVYKSKSGILPSNSDLTNLATYLDWSYQEQVGVPANASNKEEATKYGVGALDTWALFTSLKNKLEKNNC